MRTKSLIVAACIVFCVVTSPVLAQQSDAPERVALSVDSAIGELLDDPAARAILAAELTDFVDNPRLAPLRQMSLRTFQGLSRPEAFPESKLNAIAAALASAPAAENAAPVDRAVRMSRQSAQNGARMGVDATLGDLLDNPRLRAVLARELPALVNAPDAEWLRPLSLRSLQQIAPQALTNQKLQSLDAALRAEGDAQ